MALPGELGIRIVVDHDAVLAPQRDNRHRGAKNQGETSLEAGWPVLDGAERRGAPIELRNNSGSFTTISQERMEDRHLLVQVRKPCQGSNIRGNSVSTTWFQPVA